MVYLLDTTPLLDDLTFKKYYNSCPGYRKRKTDALADRIARAQSVGAEILLSYGMHDLENPDYDISISESGKPYDKNSEIFFNLSHSGMYAAAVFDEVDVGIDIEVPKKVDLKLAERYFSPDEQILINRASDKETELLRIWTRKESLLKACGKGISVTLSEISTVADRVKLDGAEYSIATVSESGYILSVARKGSPEKIITENILIM